MVCIYCGSTTRVTNSRRQKQSNQIWRRRLCLSCSAVFTSTESVDYPKSFALEMPDGSLRPFKKEKLFLSILKSCEHRKTALDDAIALTDTVLTKTLDSGSTSVLPAHQVVKNVHKALLHFDHASAVQFAAYHPDYAL
jgi:transcriptional regulator NrdR family protein